MRLPFLDRNNSWRESGGKDRDEWHGDGDHLKYQDMENEKDGDKRYGCVLLHKASWGLPLNSGIIILSLLNLFRV